jgi:hypothetical protein
LSFCLDGDGADLGWRCGQDTHPHQVAAPVLPSVRVRRHPSSRLRRELRASLPVRHFTSLRDPGPRWTTARPAMATNSELSARTSALAFSLRRRNHALMS